MNTLTNLIGPLYKALDIVSREMVGAIPTVTLDADVARAAVGQQVFAFKTPTVVATDITPGQLPPNDGDQNIDSVSLTMQKSRRVPFRWNGEEERGLANSGTAPAAVKRDQLTQAIRALVNEMEMDVIRAARVSASRAYGTPGSTPFATGLGDTAQLRKILDDNGAPLGERSLIIDSSAGANLRTNTQLTKANESGTTMTMRDGALLDLHGFSIHESAGVVQTLKGTGASYTTNTAGYAVGSTAVSLISGTGTVQAGDIVTFAGDQNKYVVKKDLGTDGAGVLTLCQPGLRVAIPAAATAMSLSANFTANVAYTKPSIILATRMPSLPDGGDMAVDRMTIVDPRSGIAFEVAMYAAYRQMQYEVSCAWGTKGIKDAHTAILLG